MAKKTDKSETKEVAAQGTTLPATQEDQLKKLAELGYDVDMLEGDAGVGSQNVGQQDVATPYLYVLQPLSPQVQSHLDSYIDGARPGMFFNNANQQVYPSDPGLEVVPVFYERKYVEWIDRDLGGGWVGEHDVDSDILEFAEWHEDPTTKRKVLRLKSDPSHIIVETAYHYTLMRDPDIGIFIPLVIPMKSTALKVNRQWNQIITTTLIPGTGKKAPRWLYPYRLSTRSQTDGKNTWFTFQISRMENPVDRSTYEMAKQFHQLVTEGQVKRAAETNVGQATEPAEDDVPGFD